MIFVLAKHLFVRWFPHWNSRWQSLEGNPSTRIPRTAPCPSFATSFFPEPRSSVLLGLVPDGCPKISDMSKNALFCGIFSYRAADIWWYLQQICGCSIFTVEHWQGHHRWGNGDFTIRFLSPRVGKWPGPGNHISRRWHTFRVIGGAFAAINLVLRSTNSIE